MISSSKLKLLIVGFLLAVLCSTGYAVITSATISPAQPTTSDIITFTVEGLFSDACWHVTDFDFSQESSTQSIAEVFAVDNASPEVVCPMVIIEYSRSVNFGPLEPGDHNIFVVEHHESMREPWDNTTSLNFEVRDSLPPIRNLTVRRIGNDIVLRWTAIPRATMYRIYRDTESEFECDAPHLLDSCTTVVFTDHNAIIFPHDRFFYQVMAIR